MNIWVADEIQKQCDLLSLNDDCFREILKHLEPKDLCSIANVCTSLRYKAEDVFLSRYKEKFLTEAEEIIEECLRIFGSKMKTIRLQSKKPWDWANDSRSRMAFTSVKSVEKSSSDSNILHLLLKYCGSLKSLEMKYYSFRGGAQTEMLVPLFSRLDKVIMQNVTITSKLASMLDVPELSLIEIYVMRDIMNDASNVHFSRLKTIKIHCFICQNDSLSIYEAT